MSRAMFSGVAGMQAEQTKMDVIGNNIANVNTYGYKAQRAIFSDVYYQTLNAATRGTATQGGTDPSTVGVGATMMTVQTLPKQSAMQTTGYGMDVAISGEGYLQVMDGSGNVFYTKAGMLGWDANTGYLVDMNGNFVLGDQGTAKGDGMQKIKLDNVGAVQPKAASKTEEIDGVNYTVSAQKASKDGNLSVNYVSSDQLPIGKPVDVSISNGTVVVTLNANEKFASLDDLNNKVNSAILVANNGKPLDCGNITLSTDTSSAFAAGGLTGKQITEANTGFDYGSIDDLPSSGMFGGFKLDSVGSAFENGDNARAVFKLTRTPVDATTGAEDSFTMTCKIGTKTYTGTVSKSQMKTPGKLQLSNGGSTTDTITMSYPNYSTVMNAADIQNADFPEYKTADNVTQKLSDGQVLGGLKLSGMAAGTEVTDVKVTYASGAATLKVTLGAISGYTPAPATSDTGDFTYAINPNTDFTKGSVSLANGTKTITATLPSKAEFFGSAIGPKDTNNVDTGILFKDPTSELTDLTKAGYAVKNTEKSKNLGLTSKAFVMEGGTAGGPVSLNQIDNIAIGADGAVTVHNADKGTVQVGRICIATFANPSGLQASGNNYFTSSLNSGNPVVSIPGQDSAGKLKSSALEMSNVDLATEFSEMILTQRGFQANSRTITVSDSMMEELINLKR